MIRCMIKNKIFWYILVAMLILGYTTGNNMANNIESYITTFYQRPIFYSLIIANTLIDYILFKKHFQASLIVRYKDILSLLKQNLVIEIIYCALIFLILHIGIAINKIDLFIQIYPLIIKIFFNYIIITIGILSIIKFIDTKINNHVLSIVFVIGIIVFTDVGLDLYQFLSGKTLKFIIQYIYIIPYTYKNYIMIDIFLLLSALFFTIAAIHQMTQKDCIIKRSNYEN